MTTIEQFTTTDALIAESKALRAQFSALMSDMYEANAVLAQVVEQSRKIHPCTMCDD